MTTTLTPPRFFITLLLFVASMTLIAPVAEAMAVTRGHSSKFLLTTTQPTPARISVRMFQASQTLEIQYEADRDIAAKVVITNIIGKTAQVTPLELQAGENTNKIDVANLPQGTYIVQIISGNWTSEARKFVKANP
jgi:Secretion system C-terminal sorting domain